MSQANSIDRCEPPPFDAEDRALRFARQRLITWMIVLTLAAAVIAGLFPWLSNWTLGIAIPIVWAMAFTLWPNLVKYGTVFVVAGGLLAAVAAPALRRARDRARINTAEDHLRSQGAALQHWQLLHGDGGRSNSEGALQAERAEPDAD